VTLTQYAPINNPSTGYRFAGFGAPHFTQVPDIFFDEVAPNLSEAELRVALYIIRRTFGWKKDHDRISLKQMVEGITSRDGTVIDHGTGMSKAGVARGIKGLVTKCVIVSERNSSQARGDEPTTYRLRFEGDDLPVSIKETPPCPPNRQARVSQVDTQDRREQDKKGQESFEVSKAPSTVETFVENARESLAPQIAPQSPPIVNLIADFSREMGDTKHLGSNVTQAHRLFAESDLTMDDYFTVLYEARLRTRKVGGVINRMSYFFTVLRDLLSLPEET
jgi:hypothetical protein